MEIINQVADPDELYQSNPLVELADGTIQCPVCKKIYKRKKSAENHFAKQNCHTTLDIFADTPYEEAALELYQSIIAEENPRARINLVSFRKSKSYSVAVRFCVFCYLNEIEDFGLYIGYLKSLRGWTMTNAALSNGQNEEVVREYRIFLHANPRYVDSKTFWERHGDELYVDEDFFIRSLEKAHITLSSVNARKKAKDMVDNLPIGYQYRIAALIDQVEAIK